MSELPKFFADDELPCGKCARCLAADKLLEHGLLIWYTCDTQQVNRQKKLKLSPPSVETVEDAFKAGWQSAEEFHVPEDVLYGKQWTAVRDDAWECYNSSPPPKVETVGIKTEFDAITADQWVWLYKSASGTCTGPCVGEPSITRVAKYRGKIMSQAAGLDHILQLLKLSPPNSEEDK